MGVSLEVWHQHIGSFRQRPPSSSRKVTKGTVEADFSPSALILLCVCAGNLIMHDITVYGDIERNPGPTTPPLPDNLLTSLKNGTCTSTSVFKHDLKMKHILQLLAKRNEQKATEWAQITEWMQLFHPPNSFEDKKKWQRLLRDSWSTIKGKYTKLNKSKNHPSGKKDLEEWLESNYSLPTPRPPKEKPTTSTAAVSPPSVFDIEVAKAEVKKLEDDIEKYRTENKELKQQNESLKQRPSPHTHVNTKRRECNHKATISQHRDLVKSLEKTNENLEQKVHTEKKNKRNLMKEFESAAKFAKTDAEQNRSLHNEMAEDLEDENQKLRQKVISLNQKLNDVMVELDHVTNAFHEAKNQIV